MTSSTYIPPYAPATPSSFNSYSISTRAGPSGVGGVSLNEEIKLSNTAKQRQLYESLADIYSIIVSLDYLEKAYLRDSITPTEYTSTCQRLITQYNSILKHEDVAASFESLDKFRAEYSLECASAIARLKVGIPATVENTTLTESSMMTPTATGSNNLHISDSTAYSSDNNNINNNGGGGQSAKAVATAIEKFITCIDALKLQFRAKDDLHPLLSDVITYANKVTTQDFEGRGKLISWLIKLNSMDVGDQLSEDDSRTFVFDLSTAYNGFNDILS
ncbi:ESCRT-1 complex, Vps28 subunit [Nadsonia fulvescens var. elongata DSM 6958]|uniref:Vacuolar protein sorting-associated protein 28 n=1 Tax=Nadsonia fulvescens var. elongata DSM 6958 TaxID=857566 RepID=A0A1E3PNK4_9ASCO|nr:ESCRT-1 complex, Vps28 subunit [Nadsonia fulvescens var. elongata DSM 6958]